MQSNKSNGQLTAQISVQDVKKSGFDLSNNVLGTGKIGRIIPTRALHVIPNDTIKGDTKIAVQFEPLAVPILANMEVKQEHYYIPYNVVWSNWDKFISGGEKMDYKGVVPNVSMSNMVEAIYEHLSLLSIPLTKDSQGNFKVNVQDIHDGDTISAIREVLTTQGDALFIKDLLKPQFEALRLLETHAANPDDADAIAFYKVTQVADLRMKLQQDYCNSKYIQELGKGFEQLLAEDKTIFLPTNTAVSWLLDYYEYYKPLIGIGSNIDYLNMARITFTDFLYVMSVSVFEQGGMSTASAIQCYPQPTALSTKGLSVLNLRANYSVWYNNYRDILLESDAYEPQDSDAVSSLELFILLIPRQRCWEKDAFTTALDNPGTGNVAVPININEDINEKMYVNIQGEDHTEGNGVTEVTIDGESYRVPSAYLIGNTGSGSEEQVNGFSLYALDAAQRAQKWLQKALYFGNRISDFYYMHFGVRFLDARLRLPELLTSSTQLVKIDTIMNNTTTAESIAGDRAGFASAYDEGNSFDRFVEEHGVIMSFMTIMPQVTYAYGCNRDYSRLDQFDYAFTEFATLGMDAVYNNEITSISVNLPNQAQDVEVFGYQGKYYDYKAKHSEEHGELLDSQDMYTFGRKFNMYDPDSRPRLNYEFVHCFPDLDMFVVDSPTQDLFRYDIRHSTAAERPLPSQSIYI